MENLIAKDDIYVLNHLLFKKGQRIIKNDSYKLSTDGGELIIPHYMIDSLIEEESILDIKISEISEQEEDEIKNWRMQLDIRTSRKKVKEIENILRETLREYI